MAATRTNDQDNDQETSMTDHPLGNPDTADLGEITLPTLSEAVLDLDEVMSSARRVERTAHVSLRGDLVAERHELLEELAQLVDADGHVLGNDDDTLGAGARAGEIQQRLQQIDREQRGSMRTVRFRAMPDDEWDAFELQHRVDVRGGDRTIKDPIAYNEQLIARTAIAPKMSVEDVRKLRGQFGPVQMMELANKAYLACTTGGLDVPKLPSYSVAPKPQAS